MQNKVEFMSYCYSFEGAEDHVEISRDFKNKVVEPILKVSVLILHVLMSLSLPVLVASFQAR